MNELILCGSNKWNGRNWSRAHQKYYRIVSRLIHRLIHLWSLLLLILAVASFLIRFVIRRKFESWSVAAYRHHFEDSFGNNYQDQVTTPGGKQWCRHNFNCQTIQQHQHPSQHHHHPHPHPHPPHLSTVVHLYPHFLLLAVMIVFFVSWVFQVWILHWKIKYWKIWIELFRSKPSLKIEPEWDKTLYFMCWKHTHYLIQA